MLTTTVNLAGGVAPGTLQYMPAGNHGIDATVNGNPQHRDVFVDSAAADRLQADLTEKLAASAAGKAARPCFYFDHKKGPAACFPTRFFWDKDKGVCVDVEWTATPSFRTIPAIEAKTGATRARMHK